MILWHELWLLLSLSLLAALTWNQPNQVGLWTFAVLWCMRASAKLNLFLGVRNLGLEFLPRHLSYLQHYFRKASMNLLMPISVTLSTVVVVWLVREAMTAEPSSATAIGRLLVATMLAMGVLEHWMLVLPMNPSTLWRWALRNDKGRSDPPDRNPVGGVRTAAAQSSGQSGSGASKLRIPNDDKLLHARSA